MSPQSTRSARPPAPAQVLNRYDVHGVQLAIEAPPLVATAIDQRLGWFSSR